MTSPAGSGVRRPDAEMWREDQVLEERRSHCFYPRTFTSAQSSAASRVRSRSERRVKSREATTSALRVRNSSTGGEVRGTDFASLPRQSPVQKQPVMRGMSKCFRPIVFLGQVVQIEVGLLSSGLSVCRSVLRAEGKTLQYFHVTSTLANCVFRCSNILPQFM